MANLEENWQLINLEGIWGVREVWGLAWSLGGLSAGVRRVQ